MSDNKTNVENEEVTIKTAKGLVGEPFKAKDGKEYCEVKIPNKDENDKTPWASFVVRKANIHEDKFGKGMWFKLPKDGTISISKPVLKGKDENGKNMYENSRERVTNTELKGMVEYYKEKEREIPETALENAAADKSNNKSFKDRVKEAKEQIGKDKAPKKTKEKSKNMER